MPTALGQVLLNAAALYEIMALHADKELIRRSLFSDQPTHLRRTIQQACASPRVDLNDSYTKGKHYDDNLRPNPVMVDQLWIRITGGNTVVTSFPKRYGRDLADPSSIYLSIRRRLIDKAAHIAIEPYDIALVVLDECISSFFQQPGSVAAELKEVPYGISVITQQVSTIVGGPL